MINLQISALEKGYQSGELTVAKVIEQCLEISLRAPKEVWIYKLSAEEIAPYVERLAKIEPSTLPLYGIPFVIKDNIDLAGVPTTAGCPNYSYTPAKSSFVVAKLIEAGAIPLGKSNLDQFATGLVGTRSPYGACPNSFDSKYISGGSSSGSAVAVALGCCSFSLGTDTAGSGRVPAAFNNLIGVKPSRGLLSCSGVVAACKSLDCISIFALDSSDAAKVLNVAQGVDDNDCYSRQFPSATSDYPKAKWSFGVPRSSQLKFFGNSEYEFAFKRSVELLKSLGGECQEVDFSPFIEAAQLLYSGPWVNERYAAVGDFIEEHKCDVLETTKNIILSGKDIAPYDVFKAMYKMQRYKKLADKVMDSVDFLVTPTAGSYYTIAEVQENPVELNTNLGYYTNYMNLLDYASIAVPTSLESKIPFGVTLVSKANCDEKLLSYAGLLHNATGLNVGKSDFTPCAYISNNQQEVTVAVCGAHLKGYPLHWQLEDLNATFLCATQSAYKYRMFAFCDENGVAKPGLIYDIQNGNAIYVELYTMSYQSFGEFVSKIPAPLGIGKIELSTGEKVCGFIAESIVMEMGKEITNLGDWRKYS